MNQEKEVKDCCKDLANHKTHWQMNIFEDWEPAATYCKCCQEIIEDYAISGGRN